MGLAAALVLAACAIGTGGEQTLVDRAALTVQEMMTQNVSQDPKSLLRHARGVLICPRVFKAGFFFGGEGGSCVLLARSGNGTWSYPTFYDIGSGSFGFQFGVQDSQLLLLIMTNRGLNAVMDSQVRLGAGASVAVASVGAGIQGATTAAVGADIVAFAAARGLFGGVSIEGGVMSARIDENQATFGGPPDRVADARSEPGGRPVAGGPHPVWRDGRVLSGPPGWAAWRIPAIAWPVELSARVSAASGAPIRPTVPALPAAARPTGLSAGESTVFGPTSQSSRTVADLFVASRSPGSCAWQRAAAAVRLSAAARAVHLPAIIRCRTNSGAEPAASRAIARV
jgi:lipid-binding SYLF domain-containing protein